MTGTFAILSLTYQNMKYKVPTVSLHLVCGSLDLSMSIVRMLNCSLYRLKSLSNKPM